MWISLIGFPSILIWVIGAPVLAFIILFKHRRTLEEGLIKKYLLILYQGLNQKSYYWEFLNTTRKVMILSIYTVLSFTSVEYRVILSLVMLLFMLRMQQALKPYKLAINNELEMKAITAGTLTLYCGILFSQNDGDLPVLKIIALAILLIFNLLFLIEWVYYFIRSFNSKNEKVITLLRLYAMILCKKYNQDGFTPPHEASIVNTKQQDKTSVKARRRKKVVKHKNRVRKQIIKGQIANKKNREELEDDIFQPSRKLQEAEHETSLTPQLNARVEEVKQNEHTDRSDNSSQNDIELVTYHMKNKSAFGKGRRLKIGQMELDDESSQDSY